MIDYSKLRDWEEATKELIAEMQEAKTKFVPSNESEAFLLALQKSKARKATEDDAGHEYNLDRMGLAE